MVEKANAQEKVFQEVSEKLLRNEWVKEVGLTAINSATRKKLVITVYDLTLNLSEENVKEEVMKKNIQESVISAKGFRKDSGILN
ncbi:hypothetical protein J6590_071621 [Homalodisca vitripennis]|nr:hypothetical protein J6590_071621 [Homalodisca vitripennis]